MEEKNDADYQRLLGVCKAIYNTLVARKGTDLELRLTALEAYRLRLAIEQADPAWEPIRPISSG